MIILDHVAYYDIQDIQQCQGNTLTETEIITVLEANPSYGRRIDTQWYSYHLAIKYMSTPPEFIRTHFLAGVQGYNFIGLCLNGKVLDVGAGGEGIIGQVAGDQAIGIAPAVHKKGLQDAPGSCLKILMDARDMQFLDDMFDTVTAFYTLMYIDPTDHFQVFTEIFRVLKPSGEFLLWDMTIPAKPLPGKSIYVLGIEVHLKDKKVLTGYGTQWDGKHQDASRFRTLGEAAGFQVVEEQQTDLSVYMRFIKPLHGSRRGFEHA